jgi:hypothetical protein
MLPWDISCDKARVGGGKQGASDAIKDESKSITLLWEISCNNVRVGYGK